MMLLKQSISCRAHLVLNKSKTMALAALLVLQGCSSLVTDESEQTQGLDSLGQDIVDMVELEPGQHATANSKVSAPTKGRNLYQEQASQRLANVPQGVIEQYQQALNMMKKQQWQQAEQLFDQVLAAQPQLSGAYVNKALIAIGQQQLAKASGYIEQALVANADNPYAYQVKGRLARLKGQFTLAEQYYRKALDIWPHYPEVHINLAVLLELYRGRLLEARQHYLSYLALKPEDKQAKQWLASVEIKIKRAGLNLPEVTQGEG